MAFRGCQKLTSITIPENVTSIGAGAFSYCTALTSIAIPGNVTKIGGQAFRGCTGLTSIIIPENVTEIGEVAFGGCTGLTSIYVMSETAPTIISTSFDDDTYSNATLYVPTGTLKTYQETDGWKEFSNIQEFDPTGIDGIIAEEAENNLFYDLNGRTIENPGNGIYIVNGKKVLIK